MSIGELSLLLPLLLIMILAIGRISSFCLPSHKGFYKMILNTNNEEYLNSFVSQQPMISCFKVEAYEPNIFHTEAIYERHNFTYGSWELEPPQFANVENEVVIYLLKEKYILNYEANEKFKEFSQNLKKQVYYQSARIEYDRADTRLILFNKRNSKIFNFLISENCRILYKFFRIFGLHWFYEVLFYILADKYIEIPVVKNISLDKDEYQYKYNQFELGSDELKHRSEDDGEMTKLYERATGINYNLIIIAALLAFYFER